MITDEDVDAVLDCLRSGWLTMGPRIQAFEEALGAQARVRHALAVSSGAAALQLALRGAGVGPGDEVLVPALGSVDATTAVRACGARAVAVDGGLQVDVDDLAGRIADRTRAVVASHVLGYAPPVAAIAQRCAEHGIALVEDATQALGTGVPVTGVVRCVGFAPGNQISVGEGGAVLTDDEDLAGQVRSLRSHAMTSVTWDRHRGHAETYDILDVGFNYRMDEARAALATSALRRLEGEAAGRRARARALAAELGDAVAVSVADIDAGSPLALPLLASGAGAARDRLRDELAAAGHDVLDGPWLTVPAADATPRAADVAARLLAVRL